MSPTVTTLKPPAAPNLPDEPPAKPAPGPLRNGNPRGNPNLAPRCGAKNRAGNPCRAPAMANGRCRLHGGKCTGPRTAEGKAAFIATHTKHGRYAAPQRATNLYVRTLTVRTRLVREANRLSAHLPRDMAARLAQGPDELWPPVHPSNAPYVTNPESAWRSAKSLLTATFPNAARPDAAPRDSATLTPHRLAAERLAARAEKAALVPWRQAIAAARAAKRAARAAKSEAKAARQQARAARIKAQETQRAARAPAADGLIPGREMPDPPVSRTGLARPPTTCLLPTAASCVTGPSPATTQDSVGRPVVSSPAITRAVHPNAPCNSPAAPPVPIVPCTGDSLLERELAARAAGLRAPANRPPQGASTPGPAAPFKPSRIDPMNREPAAKPAIAPFKPFRIEPMNREPTTKPGAAAHFKPSRIDPLNRAPKVPPNPTHLTPTKSAALGSTTLANTWEPGLASQLVARCGHPAPAPGWRIPQAMPETGPVAAALRGFLAAHQTRAT